MKKKVVGLYRYIRGPTFLDYLFSVILNPILWITIDDEVSKDANHVLYLLVEKYHRGEISVDTSDHGFEFGENGIKIWVSNYPYSYGHVFEYSKSKIGIDKYPNPTRYAKVLFRRFEKEVRKSLEVKESPTKDVNVIIKRIEND